MRAWGRTGELAPAMLAVLLLVISWPTAMKLGGPAAASGYGLGLAVTTLVLLPSAADLLRRAPTWVLPSLVAVCVVGLAAAFVLGFPPTYGEVMGVGSDRADALDVALSRLADGLYPYTGTTYLGNPITPLPGALLLAAPFHAITGHAGWQNVAWTLLLLPVLNAGRRLRPRPTVLWALTVLGGLEVLRQFVIGDHLVTGAVPAVAATAWTLRAAAGGSTRVLVVAGVAMGVATCTRPHMALVVVVVVVAVAVASERRRAVVVGVSAGLVWAALIVPFLVGGVARFSPLHVAAKVTGDRAVTTGIVVVALGAVAMLVVALRLFAPTLLSLARRVTTGSIADLTLGAAAVPFAVWAVASGSGRSRDGRPEWSAPGVPTERSVPVIMAGEGDPAGEPSPCGMQGGHRVERVNAAPIARPSGTP